MTNKQGRMAYILYACIFLIMAFFFLIVFMNTQGEFRGFEILLFSQCIMCASLAYLYPQFKKKDERVTHIKQKGMSVSYFFFIGYAIIFMVLLETNLLTISAYQLLSLLTALMISTVFLSFVFFARKY